MPVLKLHLFGPPRVELDGIPIEFQRRKALALLIYLAVSGQPHSREALATLFWPDHSQSQGRAYLRRDLAVLNGSLAGDWLDVDRETIELKPSLDPAAPAAGSEQALWVDVAEFSRLLAAHHKHNHPAGATCSGCLPLLSQAAALYSGDFLAGFTLRDCPEFDEWQFFQTESLRQALAVVLERLVQSYSAQSQFETAVAYARRWLALDPLHEPAQRALIYLYDRSGQIMAALRQYEEYVELLEKELGLPPEEETTTLYEAVKAKRMLKPFGQMEASFRPPATVQPQLEPGDAGADQPLPPTSRAVSPEQATPAHRLPLLPTTFVGREEELAEIRRMLLAEPGCRLVTLIGPGGIGKTRLAIEAAHSFNFSHGARFVSLAPLSSASFLIPAIADELGLSLQGSTEPKEQLLAYLRDREMLLVLDSFEHLLPAPGETNDKGKSDGAALLAEILNHAPRLKILVTSRERLNLSDEWIFTVPGLSLPEGDGPIDPESFSAMRLFIQRARQVRQDVGRQPVEQSCIARTCRLVGGMPLAIELAAGWLGTLSCTEIVTEIEQNLDFLTSSLHDIPERHRSIRAVFEQSWRMLSEEQRAVFANLSLFRGGFRREAAREITGASLPLLASLVDKSLLRLTPSGRYELHELLRQFGAGKLAEAPDQATAGRDRHSAYYCALLKRYEADLKGDRQQPALAEIEADIENIRAAWNWAAEQGQIERLAQALESLALFFDWYGRYQEGVLACRLAAEKLAPAETAERLRLLVKVLTWQSNFNWALGQSEPANQQLRQNLALLDSPLLAGQDTRPEKAAVLLRLGQIALSSDREEARRLVEQSLNLYRTTGEPWWTAHALGWLGEVDWEAGRYDRAKQLGEESLALRQALGDQEGIANALSLLGWIALTQGQLEEARRLHQDSLDLYRSMAVQAPAAGALRNLGAAFIFLGQFDQALAALEEALASFNDLGGRSNLVFANILAGAARLQLGQYEQAQAQLQLGLKLARASGDQPGIGYAYAWLGRLALTRQAYTEAWQLQHDCIEIFRRLGQQDQLSLALASMGLVIYKLGKAGEARRYLAEALQTAAEIGAFIPLLFALPLAALLLAGQDEPERAVELYALAARYPFVARSRWMDEMFGQPIATAAATLPPEQLAAAQNRGQARDLWLTAAELLAELEGYTS